MLVSVVRFHPLPLNYQKVFGRTDMQQTLNLCGKPQREFNSHSTYSKGIVAQWLEHTLDKRGVIGSSPISPILKAHTANISA